MPKRTNERQQIVEMLRALAAPPGAVVTPSMMLPHATGDKREVDVVVRTRDNSGERYQSFEVVDRGRKATVEWAEQVIKKHEGLPTTELFLVAWKGFTAGALRVVAHAGGWVNAVVPRSTGNTPTLSTQELVPTLGWVAFDVIDSNGMPRTTEANEQNAIDLHSPAGELVGTSKNLGQWYLWNSDIWQRALAELESVPERHASMWAELTLRAQHLPEPLCLLVDGRLAPVVSVRMAFGLSYREQVLTLVARTFGSEQFAHVTAEIAGRRRIVVGLLDEPARIGRWLVQPAPAAAGRCHTEK